ncbi:substrate-binding periplasmic protein [Chitinimonas sp. JJ19]|uniref:substrate-binding periplasmic protein n=1 Tax=Chitinimonas sp. JJ19 TaxID=3109352 RepID=UPI003001FFB4
MVSRWMARAALALILLAGALPASARELLVVGTQFGRLFEQVPSGEFEGLAVTLVREFARASGHTVRFDIYPWARAQMVVQTGKADMLIGPYKTPEREQLFAFSDKAFYRDEMVFYARAGSSTRWDGDYAQLRGLRIAAIRGWAYGAGFEAARAQVDMTNNLQSGILMLSEKRVDLLATNRRNTEALLATMASPPDIQAISPIIEVQDGYFAFPKSAEAASLRAEFNVFFNNLIRKGELARLARQHGVTIP